VSTKSEYPYAVGTRVVALCQIVEDGSSPGNPESRPLEGDFIHAEPGEEGVVEDVDSERGIPSVRFNRTGTATIVSDSEIKEVEE